MHTVDEFLENLLVEKGIADIDSEAKARLKEDMKERLLKQIDEAAVAQLSPEKTEKLAMFMEDPNFNNISMAEFMKSSGVNMTEVAIDAMLKFRDQFLGE